MELIEKRYSELSVDEIYDILKTRISVFVVEQKCPYMEIDDKDQQAVHLWYRDETGILAYLRVLPPGVSSPYAAIGRVLTTKREAGLGSMILNEGIRAAKQWFGADKIYLEAQVYAVGFYEKHGFAAVSEPFDEDGIPHVKMIR